MEGADEANMIDDDLQDLLTLEHMSNVVSELTNTVLEAEEDLQREVVAVLEQVVGAVASVRRGGHVHRLLPTRRGGFLQAAITMRED
jgi:hypothetical protein